MKDTDASIETATTAVANPVYYRRLMACEQTQIALVTSRLRAVAADLRAANANVADMARNIEPLLGKLGMFGGLGGLAEGLAGALSQGSKSAELFETAANAIEELWNHARGLPYGEGE